MARVDADAIERVGIPARVLMETAGRAVAAAVRRHFPAARRPLVACGPGNNGGDGFVVARVLREWDRRCQPLVIAPAQRERQSPEARACFELLVDLGVEVLLDLDAKELEAALARCDLLIDALFGVGLSRPVQGASAALIEQLARAGLPCVAVDLPSGVSSETGAPLGPALPAQLIVTLGLPKLGLVVRPPQGRVEVVDIGLPLASVERAAIRQWLHTPAAVARLLPPRPPDAHKGSFGHVLVVGGSEGKTGAVVLAATGALRAGAGLATAAVGASLHPVLELKLTEAMSLALPELGRGALGPGCAPLVRRELETRDALVLGPGLGRQAGAQEAVRAILGDCPAPAVVDADGLTALGGALEELAATARGRLVLTPHPGEAARLLGCSAAQVQADRPAAARALAERSGAVAVLKGARTLIAAPEGSLWINPTGGPGLATGGTGDVLAGVIGGLLAQGLAPLDAARLGVYLHGAAGDLGPRAGGLAGEVAERIPAAWSTLAAGQPDAAGDPRVHRLE
jgi:NAD(P)H-hydrate epimerase